MPAPCPDRCRDSKCICLACKCGNHFCTENTGISCPPAGKLGSCGKSEYTREYRGCVGRPAPKHIVKRTPRVKVKWTPMERSTYNSDFGATCGRPPSRLIPKSRPGTARPATASANATQHMKPFAMADMWRAKTMTCQKQCGDACGDNYNFKKAPCSKRTPKCNTTANNNKKASIPAVENTDCNQDDSCSLTSEPVCRNESQSNPDNNANDNNNSRRRSSCRLEPTHISENHAAFQRQRIPRRDLPCYPVEEMAQSNSKFNGKTQYCDEFQQRSCPPPCVVRCKEPPKTKGKFYGITTQMQDFRPNYNVAREESYKPEAQYKPSPYPFDGRSTYRVAHQRFPVAPPELPPWAKKSAYKPSKNYQKWNSVYQQTFKAPEVCGKVEPVKLKEELCTLGDDCCFKKSTEYDDEFREWCPKNVGQVRHADNIQIDPEEPHYRGTTYRYDFTGRPAEYTQRIPPKMSEVTFGCDREFKTEYRQRFVDPCYQRYCDCREACQQMNLRAEAAKPKPPATENCSMECPPPVSPCARQPASHRPPVDDPMTRNLRDRLDEQKTNLCCPPKIEFDCGGLTQDYPVRQMCGGGEGPSGYDGYEISCPCEYNPQETRINCQPTNAKSVKLAICPPAQQGGGGEQPCYN